MRWRGKIPVDIQYRPLTRSAGVRCRPVRPPLAEVVISAGFDLGQQRHNELIKEPKEARAGLES